MKTYQLTNEEKANYQNTGVLKMGKALTKKDLTKEAFIARKEQGRTDLSIAREYGVHGPDISKLREQWGLTGMKAADFKKKPDKLAEKQQPKVEEAEYIKDELPDNEVNDELSESHAKLIQDFDQLQEKYNSLSDDHTLLKGSYKTLETDYGRRMKRIDNLETDLSALQREHSTLQSTHKSTLEAKSTLQEDYEALNEYTIEQEKRVSDLDSTLKETVDENLKLWETNKRLLEEKEQPSSDRYEALYKATVKALAVHLPA
ncbi:hypothetical protein MKX54_14225 [Alkalihalobacillus sp. FSL R5-0424]